MPQPCRPCHAAFFGTLAARNDKEVHRPVREGQCHRCHDVHGGTREHLVRGEPAGLCSTCHTKLVSAHHLYRIEDLEAKEGGGEARERGCLHCHEPHAAAEPRLLLPKRARSCAGCHSL